MKTIALVLSLPARDSQLAFRRTVSTHTSTGRRFQLKVTQVANSTHFDSGVVILEHFGLQCGLRDKRKVQKPTGLVKSRSFEGRRVPPPSNPPPPALGPRDNMKNNGLYNPTPLLIQKLYGKG
jgi:hypothetical protein